jgi:hypothetical protein
MVLHSQTPKTYIQLKMGDEFLSISVSAEMQVAEIYSQNYLLLCGNLCSHSQRCE